MNCGIFIVARLGSQRLQAKHLQKVGETPIILILLRRIRQAFREELSRGTVRVVIVTSDEPENRLLAEVVGAEAEVFYGSIRNIPLRQEQAASRYGMEQIVSVDGDDILCSPAGMRAVAEAIATDADYTATSGLPFGMNSFGYRLRFLSNALARNPADTLETGWGRIFAGREPRKIPFAGFPPDERLRFTLDYAEDLAFFRSVLAALGPGVLTADDARIVSVVFEQRLFTLNAGCAQEYWANFRRQVQKEKEHAG